MFFGFMTSKLIVCSMAKREVETFAWDNLYYLLAVIFGIWSECYHLELCLMAGCSLVLAFRYSSFMIGITLRLLNYLNINF